ncbi:hypothetical protein AGMMS49944_19390 [Spirochaetia bacterium]|nr:hypothetical protein AGMMS49944_19390 [Spirochaetia bacterium]
MATGRTISAKLLTDFDKKVIALCEAVSNSLKECIPEENRSIYWKKFGKISFSRDGGLGLGGGKLQRDAICTRGRGGKAPFSNRNLRWHPLTVAAEKPRHAREIERIEIENNTLIFVVNINGKIKKYPSDKVHELPVRFVATSKHWQEHIEIVKNWNDTQWTQNSCVIPAPEACGWYDSVETFSLLGIAVAVELYKADYETVYSKTIELLKNQDIDKNISLPSALFPTSREDITRCPITKMSIANNLDQFRKEDRGETWQPNWRTSKKDEGDDASIQIMHVNPLVEKEIRHNASNVRYGFRWSNVAMTDHSLDETLDFMEQIVRVHGRV